jgi:glycosyltransferase involved in cell wall biosynthesis
MARILLSAYACEPGRGSEPGVGWSWATELARIGHKVTVITRCANRTAIESERGHEALRFLYYDLPNSVQRMRNASFGRMPYYVAWQFGAARHVRKLFPALPFDLVHHVTYVSARYPSFMGSLGIPFWFGPVSGGEVVPAPLRRGLSAGQRCREWLRDISNRCVRFDPFMRKTFQLAQKILVTRDTLLLLPPDCRAKSTVQLAVGLKDPDLPQAVPAMRDPASPRLLYVGRLLEWKGVDIALHAIARIKNRFPEVAFTIVGQGPARARLQELAARLDLQANVRWLGWQPQGRLGAHYQSADLLLFPSLRDSGGMVVLEALAHGLPVVCTDVGGPGAIVDSTCGRALQTAEGGRQQLAEAIADATLRILAVPGLLASLSLGARVRARNFRVRDLVKCVYADVPVAEAAAR